jgi:hypothetical protein
VIGHELAVEQGKIPGFQSGDEPGQRDLGRVGRATEHAFAEEGPAELHAIKPADEIAFAPYLDRMGMTRAVERKHGALELRVDPGLLAVGAGRENAREVAVARNAEPG